MGIRERYEPGTFSWVELATSDAEAAKAFYAELFGWEYEDDEVGAGMVYSTARRDGHVVAALLGSDQPPHWNSYISVASVDEAAKKVDEAGGKVVQEPFDVMDVGRMAVIQDPSGAPVSLWEGSKRIGADLVNSPGALTWNDLMTHDVGKASEFYCEVFGWEVGTVEGAPDDRVTIRNGEQMNGGMAKLPESAGAGVPPHWLPYFAIDDAEGAAERVKGGGGELVAGPIEVPAGRFLVCADPQGAMFALIEGELDE
jgi:predicted enzyme related to lactoylglutathione lyase